VRFLIAGGGGGGVLDRHYGQSAKAITVGEIKDATALAERMKGVVRSDVDFREGLRQARVSKKHLARYYLRAIEIRRAGEPRAELGGILEDTTVYNLEHVVPLNPGPEWDLSAETVQAYSRRLGNMTLLDPTINVDIGNKGFDEKRAIYSKSPLLITQEIAEFKKWGPEEIEERQAALADDALKIWTI
jgi:hypothetical protein